MRIRWRRSGRAATQMLVELRKLVPAFLTRVDQADRGRRWSEYLATTRDGVQWMAQQILGGDRAPSRARK